MGTIHSKVKYFVDSELHVIIDKIDKWCADGDIEITAMSHATHIYKVGREEINTYTVLIAYKIRKL